MKRANTFGLWALVLLAVTACDRRMFEPSGVPKGVPDRFPLTDAGPDEFLVIERKPLVISNELRDNLPTPQPGLASRVAPSAEAQAFALLSGPGGMSVSAGRSKSPGEVSLGDALGARSVSPQIREVILADYDRIMGPERRSIVFQLTGGMLLNPFGAQRLNGPQEAERLIEAYPDATIASESLLTDN